MFNYISQNKGVLLRKKLASKKYTGLLALTSLIFFVPALLITFYNLFYWGKIYPGTLVANFDVGGLRPEEAALKISKNIGTPQEIVLVFEGEVYKIPTKAIELKYDFQESVRSAYFVYRTGNTLYDIYGKLNSPYKKPLVGLRFDFDENKLNENLSVISGQVSVEANYPLVEIVDNKIVIFNGSQGQEVKKSELKLLIGKNLASASSNTIQIPVEKLDFTINNTQKEVLKKRAEKLLGKIMVLNYEDQEFEYEDTEIFRLLDAINRYKKEEVNQLIEKLSEKIEREPQNSVFVFEEDKVKEFSPALDGVETKREELFGLIIKTLDLLSANDESLAAIDIPFSTTSPEVSTEEVNDLGIKELLGRGSSTFVGSISPRIYNIGLSSEKFNGVLVKPGETFSFNDILGDVSAYTGYKKAYIIKDGKTILGDGGGVCQVSTTLFRAALDAGLPIAERRAHSYRVTYYEQGFPPGLDATVYAPTVDLKIVNDTPAHILIQTLFDPKKATLVFEIYGTSDGRVATTTKPIVTNVTPPPEDLYIDDPTKPAGHVEQIDWKAWGAKVNFDYTVERGGEIIYEKTFYSNFRPWQAKFLRGTAPVN